MELFITVTAILGNALLAFFVLLRNRRSATNILFSLFALDTGLWSLSNYIAAHSTDLTIALFWVRLVMVLAAYQAILFFLLMHTFPSHKLILSFKKLIGLVTISIFTTIVALSPLLFPSVIINNNTPLPVPGIGMAVFIPVAIGSVIAGIFTLIRKYRRARGLERIQLYYIFVGLSTMFLFILLSNFILPVLFNNSTFIILGNLNTYPFLIAIAYAIARHRLLDIRMVFARSVAYVMLLLILALTYSGGLLLIASIFTHNTNTLSDILPSTIMTLIIAFSFQPLKRLLEAATVKIFYKEHYNSNSLLSQINVIMASIAILSELVDAILIKLLSEMQISSGSIILVKDNHIVWSKGQGYENVPEYDEENIIRLLRSLHHKKNNNIFIYDEMDEEKEKEIMHQHDLNGIVGLYVENELIGAMVLGEKLSGEIYSHGDIELLKIIAPSIAVSVKNALYYEEIEKFNITLKEEIKHETAKLQHANERLKSLDHMKDEFLSIASHELRTPMTIIKSYLWMVLSGKGGELNEKQKFYIDRAYSSAEHLISFVNDMLNVSRIESNRISLKLQAMHIDTFITDLGKDLEIRTKELGLKLIIEAPKTLPRVLADPDKIREVFMNLIGNSFKFTPTGGSITVHCKKIEDMVQIEIIDTGIGVKAEDMPKLFKKFSMLGNGYATKNTTQGTGLGLYITKSIINLHGGKVEIYSEGEGKGTTFTFTLPIYHLDDKDKLYKEEIKPMTTSQVEQMVQQA